MALSPPSVDARRTRRNVRLGSLGAALENYDFVIYLYVATALGAAFFPADASDTLKVAQTFAVYAIGFLIRPVAGILIGRIADRVGRKRLFVVNVMVMSAATLVTGLLPTYAQIGWLAPALLILMRVGQGCALGGELPAAAVFVSEHAERTGLARAASYQQMLSFVGSAAGAAVAFGSGLIATHLTPDTPSLAWRLPFLVGGVLGIISVYLRRNLDESPVFEQRKDALRVAPAAPMREVLRSHRSALLFGALVSAGLVMANIPYISFWPTYLQLSLHLSSTEALAASLISVVGALLVMPVWGRVAQRFGWRVELLGAAGVTFAGTILLFAAVPILSPGSAVALWIGLPAAIGAGGIISVVPGLVSSVFPAEVRQTGYAISYNVVLAVLAGVLSIVMVGLLSALGPAAPMYVGLIACAVAVATAVLVPRMRMYLDSGPGTTKAEGANSGDDLTVAG